MKRTVVNPGDKFNRLTFVKMGRVKHYPGAVQYFGIWRCECGEAKEIRILSVVNGLTRSCGCLYQEHPSRLKHGHTRNQSRSRTYRSWSSMMMRCKNPSFKDFRYYGGKGISVCERWKTFENFLADMGERPQGKSLDRIDGLKGYHPGNCRWATPAEQSSNKINCRYVEVNGEKLSLAEACRLLKAPYKRVIERMTSYGWSFERAVSTPVRGAA